MIDEVRLTVAFESIKAAAAQSEFADYRRPASWYVKKALQFLSVDEPGIAEIQQAALFSALALTAAIKARHGPAHNDRTWGPYERGAAEGEEE